MSTPLSQHQLEIERNKRAWEEKPLLRQIYSDFYTLILQRMNPSMKGPVVELGSGIGNLRTYLPHAICTDLFPNPWLDLVCDGYELPFNDGSLSHLILFDVFHHLERPVAFLREAERALLVSGRLLLFEPYVSLAGWLAYGCFHHEPIAWTSPIALSEAAPLLPRRYYAAQGNATRLFFSHSLPREGLGGLRVISTERFCSFMYLLSGGFSKPALYPERAKALIRKFDAMLSFAPSLFAARCLVVLEKSPATCA